MADNRTMQSDDPPEPAPAAMAARVEGAAKLVVRGADATSFLHGQLANDVSGMPVGTARRSLYLSHKGHALAEVMVVRHGRNDYELVEEGIVPLRARIAERLHQSGPTVSQTVARMERDGLLTVKATGTSSSPRRVGGWPPG